jgi:predicted phosphodiesterase
MGTINLQIKSDLHLDASLPQFRDRLHIDEKNEDLKVSPKADVLLIAGDLTSSDSYRLVDNALSEVADSVPVIIVPGNHEYDYSNVNTAIPNIKVFFKDNKNVHVLDRDCVIIEDVMFIGATLWTPRAPAYVNRWGCEGMTQDWHNSSFIKDFYFIKSMLEAPDFQRYRKVVITHFLPTTGSIPERFKNMDNSYFASDRCTELMHGRNAPVLWVHGHTHDSCRYKEGDTEIICNPYGRFGSDVNPNYQPELIVEV